MNDFGPRSIGQVAPAEEAQSRSRIDDRGRLRETIHRACLAKDKVKQLPTEERLRIIREVGDLLGREREPLVDLAIREGGLARKFASLEVDSTLMLAQGFDAILDHVRPQELPAITGRNYLIFEPYGVVGLVTPRNAPLITPFYTIFCSFGAGNATVVKPSSATPGAVDSIIRCAAAAGAPDGAIVSTSCPGEEVAWEFVENPEVDVFIMYAASPVGKDNIIKMGSYLASTKRIVDGRSFSVGGKMKKYVPELAGNDPFIVLPGAQIESAVDGAVLGGFANAGQLCFSAKRLIVHRSLYERFRERLCGKVSELTVGDPNLPDTDIGPLGKPGASAAAVRTMRDAEARGGRILVGGRCEDPFFYPTLVEFDKESLLLAGQGDGPALWSEESFAPLRSLVVFDSDAEAVRLANSGSYGLGASIFGDPEKARELASRLEVGRVVINESPLYADLYLPVGGIKDSGLYGSTPKIEEVVYAKRIHVGL